MLYDLTELVNLEQKVAGPVLHVGGRSFSRLALLHVVDVVRLRLLCSHLVVLLHPRQERPARKRNDIARLRFRKRKWSSRHHCKRGQWERRRWSTWRRGQT